MKRFVLISTGLVLIAGLPAQSQGTPRATDEVYRCADIESDADRLSCFDAAVRTLRAAEDAGVVRTVDTASIREIEREAFGFSLPNLRTTLFGARGTKSPESGDMPRKAVDANDAGLELEEINEVTLPILRLSKNRASGRLTIVLEDGQVWEQVDSRRLPDSKTKSPKQATIRRASLGSFMMTIDDSVAIRAKRTE